LANIGITSPALPQGVENARWVILDMWKMGLLQTPSHLAGSCAIGIVQPGFFLLPNSQGEQLGVPLFETLGTRTKKSLSEGENQRWGEDEYPPQKIFETYGPATWVQDGSWGYQLLFTYSIKSLGYKW
jgi:hypothetical protein